MCPELESDRGNRERNRENRESDKESRDSQELKAAAAMERADYLSREVKTSQSQMQNIVRHMQAVLQAIKQLRAELALPDFEGDENSILEDKKRISALRARVAEYKHELEAMRGQLIQEQIKQLKEQNPQGDSGAIEVEAEIRVDRLYAEINA